MDIPRHVPLVVSTRGALAEGVHVGSIAVVDAEGKLVASAGDPHALNFTRSSLKPLQALPFVREGGLERWGFGERELALMCASHSGEPMHVEIVSRMLERIGAGEAELQCGCHPPIFYGATGKTPPEGARWSPLQHNCSGKHSGFLAYCRMHGEPLARYLAPDSRLQSQIAATVREYLDGGGMERGIDGCSAPNYAIPLSRLAFAFGSLAIGATAEEAAISKAMRAHPELVSGTSRFDDAFMKTGRGDWLSKGGAQGMQAIGIQSRGLGIAVRIADGDQRALWNAVVRVMQELDLLADLKGTPLEPLVQREIRNFRGFTTGTVEPVFTLSRR